VGGVANPFKSFFGHFNPYLWVRDFAALIIAIDSNEGIVTPKAKAKGNQIGAKKKIGLNNLCGETTTAKTGPSHFGYRFTK